MNRTRKELLITIIKTTLSLVLLGFGNYLTIQAGIGVAPWDTLNLGLTATFGIQFGTASISVSLLIVLADIFLLREKIGLGTILNAVVVGKAVDLFNALDLVPEPSTLPVQLLILTVGMFIYCFEQYLYMKSALGCGPRDTMLVGLSRRIRRIPIGGINTCILVIVTATGWLLGGPIGIGTLITAFLMGPILQLEFAVMRFDATAVVHQDLVESFRVLLRSTRNDNDEL